MTTILDPDRPAPTGRPRRIAVVLKGYPRLSETFIAQELLGLERMGFDLVLFSMRHPTDGKRHPVHDEIRAPVVYLPEYLHQEPLRVLRGLLRAMRRAGFAGALRGWLRDLGRDISRNRFRRFGQACVLAAELPGDIDHLYAHFIHTPASVTRYASLMTGLAWTCSAHAKDIWTSRERDLADKLAAARWVATCTAIGRDHLAALAPSPDRVHLIYHGLDLSRFRPNPAPHRTVDGTSSQTPVEILSVGRAVPKKGFDTLVDALATLPAGLHWRFTHIGGGGELAALRRRAEACGIADRIHWRGAEDQSAVLAAYRAADLFVLPCRVADDGDRDGLPNVIVEAASQRLAVVSTTVSAIPELIHDGETGRLVAANDPAALAAAIIGLARDPELRARLAAAGERRVRASFDATAGLARLAALFDGVPPTDAVLQPGDAASPATGCACCTTESTL